MDQRMAVLDPAPLRPAPRLTAPGALLGILLLVGGAFAPWIVRVYYRSSAGCPAGPECPAPDIITPSYWDYWISVIFGARPLTADWVLINFLFGLAPFLALLIVQAALAWRAWRGGLSAALRKWSVVVSAVALLSFLWWSHFVYCLFFCRAGIPLPGEYQESTGLWQSSGVRYLAPGYWLMLSGLLLSVGSDLLALVAARRTVDPAA
jgi:hypothetical protein